MTTLAPAVRSAETAPENADVVVYGGTASGTIAAVAAAREGKRVVLIEAGRHLGGLTSGGLGMTDTGSKATIGGLAAEFYRRIYQYYTRPEAWKYISREAFFEWLPPHWGMDGKKTEEAKMQFLFEPHAAESVFNDMTRQSGVRVIYGERLDLRDGVRKRGARIEAIRMESGREFAGKVYIDGTYEGDLMAKAGVSYATGREPNSRYGETLNGILPSGGNSFARVDPFVRKGDPASGLLPRIEPTAPGRPGDGDQRNQAYNFRVCLTRVPENRVPFVKPAGYDPLQYELLARWIATMRDPRPGKSRIGEVALGGENKNIAFSFHAIPNRKTDSNAGSEFGSDYIGRSYEWADADYAKRDALWQEHKTYVQGLLWFLAQDERCPEPIRREMQEWGLARDEFTDTENWPFQLYVREARRMVSDYVMTEHDARGRKRADDGVALASYASDSHGVSFYLDEKKMLWREKGFFVHTGIFPVSYRAIRPLASQCTNLLVPLCVSSSHAAFGPIRMEPVFMMLGHAAGTAASLVIDTGTTVQSIDYPLLRDRLLKQEQIIAWPAGAGAEKTN